MTQLELCGHLIDDHNEWIVYDSSPDCYGHLVCELGMERLTTLHDEIHAKWHHHD